MTKKLTEELFRKIKEVRWDHAVTRFGYLQSKAIVMEALMQPQEITPGITLQYVNTLWILDKYLIDQKDTELFSEKFTRAFAQAKDWPLNVVRQFEVLTKEKETFVSQMKTLSEQDKTTLLTKFREYVSVLTKIQSFYVFAMPLTNFCDKALAKENPELFAYSYPYKKLDVDYLSESIRKLQKLQKSGTLTEADIRSHLDKFAWIKASYNLIPAYTQEDLLTELKTEVGSGHQKEAPEKNTMLTGLQVGIFARNRIKELSQQIWFAFESLATILARELKIELPDFYTLTYQEALAGLEGKAIPTAAELKARQAGFVSGFIDSEEVLLTGTDYEKVRAYYEAATNTDVKEIKGQIACKGKVTGTAKIVMGHKDFGKLSVGDILVTNMTTPDYMVIIKMSASIVTDEGGLSCHAAIVSREFNIPCVMGTKIATRVLKDGDLIEVDANQGLVKIIKRA